MKVKVKQNYRKERYKRYPRVEDQLDEIWRIIDKLLTPAKRKRLDDSTINIIQEIQAVKKNIKKDSK